MAQWALHYGANVAKSHNWECYGLKEEVDEVVVFPMHKIIASTEEEECSKSQLQEIKSVHVETRKEIIIRQKRWTKLQILSTKEGYPLQLGVYYEKTFKTFKYYTWYFSIM